MIKLIGFDLDDTLLNDNKIIEDKEINTINHLIDQNVKIVFASGRPMTNVIYKYYYTLGFNSDDVLYYVAFNGEAVYRLHNNITKCIYCDNLTSRDILKIDRMFKNIRYINDTSLYIYVDVEDQTKVYTNKSNEYTLIESKYNNILIQEVSDFDNYSLAHKYMVAGNPKLINQIYKDIPSTFFKEYSICISMPCFIEVFKKNNDKYKGLEKVCKEYHIDKQELMTFGDSMNDFEMVKNAQIGIAMGNSNNNVKKCANFVTDSNNNNGVSKALQKYFKIGE